MKFIYQTTKGYRVKFFILFLTVIFSTITGALFPYVIGEIVDQIFYVRQMSGFLFYFFLYAGLYLLNQCLHGGLNYVWAHLEASYVVNVRKMCFTHLMKLKADVWTSMKSGDVMKRIMDDAECFLEFVHRSLFYVFANFVQLAISIGYLLYTNIILGIAAIVMTPIMAWSIRYFMERLKERHQKINEHKGLVDAWILEMMTGLYQWKILNAHKKVADDYEAKTEQVIKEEIKLGYDELKSANVNEALTLIGQLIIYCIAALAVCKDQITVGQFVACASYFSTCAVYYNALGKKLTAISGNLSGINRVEEFMLWEEECDTPSAIEHEIARGDILFDKISFGYGEEDVLKEFQLKVEHGEKLAFVGRSGEGKSTLLQLMYRLYEPNEGRILIDGIPVSNYTLTSLRSQVAVVQQENGLFHGTLRQNISLSDDVSQDDRIWDILEGLKLKELVSEFSEGLDTIIGSHGRELSGGQKQRVAIARCIFRRPRILLLDEATSALDEVTEAAVNQYIYEQLPDTTILSVAHRFSTVLSAEKIIVIEGGHVSAIGKHERLVNESSLYRTLYAEYEDTVSHQEGEAQDE